MNSPSRILVALSLVFTAAVLPPAPADAAVLHPLEFEQLTFLPPDDGFGPVEFSGIGRVSLAYDVGPDTEYLNVLAVIPNVSPEPVWIVRNLVLHDLTMGPTYEEEAARFPLTELGATSGTPVVELAYGFTQTLEPVTDDEFAAWSATVPLDQFAPVTEAIVGVASGVATVPTVAAAPASPWFGSYSLGGLIDIDELFGCLFDIVELDSTTTVTDKNGCTAAACASSLDWLRLMNPGIDFPGTTRETYDQLSRLMNRNGPHGVWPEDMIRAKLDFIEAHGLPIEVKFQRTWIRSAQVKSTSGHTSAVDHGSGSYPSKAWLKQEMADQEDVETNVYYYEPGSNTPKGGHCVVVTGSGTTAGQDWLKIKHDNDQRSASARELKQVHTPIVVNGSGQMVLPGLGVEVKNTDGTTTKLEARVTSVVSESPKADTPQPPPSEGVGGYCEYVKRTVPPGGALEIDYPDTGSSRCYNATVWRWDRTVTPPRQVLVRQWNFNRGKTRRLTNTHDYPVTYMVHNDDYQADPYPGFEVAVSVTSAADNPHADDGDNQFAFGGYSMGGTDLSSAEFAQGSLGSTVVAGPVQAGFALDAMPARLHTGGTGDLTVFADIPSWTVYWEQTRFVVDVLAVHGSGHLRVECPTTGFVDSLAIAAPGRYGCDLGVAAPSPRFEVRLVARGGLDVEFDGLGVPSLVPVVTGANDPVPRPVAALAARPNPFNPSVTLDYAVPRDGSVELAVFDARGRRVATLVDGERAAGAHDVRWDGRDDEGRGLPAGVYLCRLVAGGETVVRRVVLVR